MKKLEAVLKKPWAAYTFAACSAVLLYMLLTNLPVFARWLAAIWRFLSPVVIGVVTAYLLNPVEDFFEKKVFRRLKKERSRHTAGVICAVACLVLFLALLLYALIPSLIRSVKSLVSNWNSYSENLRGLLDKAVALAERMHITIDVSNISDLLDDAMNKAVEWIRENVQTILTKAGDIGTSVSNFAVGVLFGVCFLAAEKSLVSLLAKVRAAVFREKRLRRNNVMWARFNRVFLRYVGCTLLDALIIGVGTLIFLLIMRMPYAGLIAVMVGVTNIIPTFGPMIGSAIGIFFLVLDKPINALWFFIFACVWQSVDGMIIKPRLFSGSLGIPGVWTLVLIIIGGKLAGILGILLAIPLAAILIILYRESIVPRLERRTAKLNGVAQGAAPSAEEPPEPPAAT